MLNQKTGVTNPGKANLRFLGRSGSRLLRRRAERPALSGSLDCGDVGVLRVFGGQAELPSYDPGEVMGGMGMEIVEFRSPGSFQHDRPMVKTTETARSLFSHVGALPALSLSGRAPEYNREAQEIL